MSFETSFPDEIILEICRFLHPTDILLSLAHLNSRLNRTISDYIRHVHLSTIISYTNYLRLTRIILPSIWSSIESLVISNRHTPCLTTLFLANSKNSLPPNLKKLILIQLDTRELFTFINRLLAWPSTSRIEELIIDCADVDFVQQQTIYGQKLAQMLLAYHPTLKSIELRGEIVFDLDRTAFLSPLFNSNPSNAIVTIDDIRRLSDLRRLTIPLNSIANLCLLLTHQQNLEYLNVHIADGKTSTIYTLTPFPLLQYLVEFHLRSDDFSLTFDFLTELLAYFPHLNSLSLDLTTDDQSFFNGHLVQTLVHSLHSFSFSIARFNQPTPDEKSLCTFSTPFWLEIKHWYTQCYWHTDEENLDYDYFHIYTIPYGFKDFDVYECTSETCAPIQPQSFRQVQRLDVSETSDANVIPFLKRCPNLRTICLNGIYDDDENYGTDEEEDITDQMDEITPVVDSGHLPGCCQTPLPLLSHVRYLSVLAFPEGDLRFFDRIIRATPKLNRLSVYIDDLLEIVHEPQHASCQTLRHRICQLEIRLDYSWLPAQVHTDLPKIARVFSNVQSLTISLCATQKRPLTIAKILFTHLLKHPTNLLSIRIVGGLPTAFEQVLKHGGIQAIRCWLATSGNTRLRYVDTFHVELNSFSITVWL